jgi:hypothetical protein
MFCDACGWQRYCCQPLHGAVDVPFGCLCTCTSWQGCDRVPVCGWWQLQTQTMTAGSSHSTSQQHDAFPSLVCCLPV